jgi:signal transduction histidine kinase
MALESSDAMRWDGQDLTVAQALAAQAALSIDNARRFAMLCVTGLAEERVRLAGELHDRTGQAVAALGLQLDIILRRLEDDETKEALQSLRMGVRSVVADLRSTMSALRCEVTEDVDLAQALHKLAGHHRVRPQVTVTTLDGDRLPLVRERQVYLLAREAIAAAASAGADNVSVCWYRDEGVPSLMVVDDAPAGVAPSLRHTGSGRVSTFSLETMRARCDALEARFNLTRTTRGTVLRCSL